MKKVHDFAEALVDEGLCESADTFFGKRKHLEDQIGIFTQKCDELRSIGETVLDWMHGLGFLLLNGQAVSDFYEAIGVDAEDRGLLCGSCWEVDFRCPRSLFKTSRYWKTVYGVYCILYESLEIYQHGRYYNDPSRPGGKKQTINLTVLEKWGKDLNAEIFSMNQNNQASQVLQFVKQFRGNEAMKERIAGADLVYTLDEDLAFSSIDLDVCGFLHVPQLPAPETVKRPMKAFCHRLYHTHKEKILEILDEVEK